MQLDWTPWLSHGHTKSDYASEDQAHLIAEATCLCIDDESQIWQLIETYYGERVGELSLYQLIAGRWEMKYKTECSTDYEEYDEETDEYIERDEHELERLSKRIRRDLYAFLLEEQL